MGIAYGVRRLVIPLANSFGAIIRAANDIAPEFKAGKGTRRVSLKVHPIPNIPDQPPRVTRAAFPKGNTWLFCAINWASVNPKG